MDHFVAAILGMPAVCRSHATTGLGDDPTTLTDRERESLGREWADQKAELVQLGRLDEFDKRPRRDLYAGPWRHADSQTADD